MVFSDLVLGIQWKSGKPSKLLKKNKKKTLGQTIVGRFLRLQLSARLIAILELCCLIFFSSPAYSERRLSLRFDPENIAIFN